MNNLFDNMHVQIKIYQEIYHGIIYIANEGRHIKKCFYWQVHQISAQKSVQDDILQRYKAIDERLRDLRLENDEVCMLLYIENVKFIQFMVELITLKICLVWLMVIISDGNR